MIQRKQSLYLFIVTILCGLLLIFPLADFTLNAPMEASSVGITEDGGIYDVWGLHYQNGTSDLFYYHAILAIMATILPAVTIFLYKKRELQLRLCIVEGIFILGLVGFEFIGAYRINEMFAMSPYIVDYSMVMTAPVACIAFILMAYKGILKDIWLLKSTDRIR